MTPQEKAKELVDKFSNEVLIDNYESKRCALIAVDEIINNVLGNDWSSPLIDYWQEVKFEIEQL